MRVHLQVHQVVLVASSISALLLACGPAVTDDPFNGGGEDASFRFDARPGHNEFVDAAPPKACQKMDIVFVVDDSGSMSEEQGNLATNFPDFVDVVDGFVTSSGDALDYRVAVTTTGRDVNYTIELLGFPGFPFNESGDNGAFRQDCGMTKRWLERGDTNVGTTFACAAQVGTGGPSLEMPLLAMDWALNDRMADGTNAGFLREDALLAIVILTDEDDCSREDNNFTIASDSCSPTAPPEVLAIDTYIQKLDTLKGERGRWATAVIAGPNSCSSVFGDAIEARRLKKFVADTGTNAVFSSICQGDLAGALQTALTTFSAACDSFPPIP